MILHAELEIPRLTGDLRPARIQLFQGDLSNIPPEHEVDALVVSAFEDSYTPNPGTLFASLADRGLNMMWVAEHKAEDRREQLGCWISGELPPQVARRFRFRRIICFEPQHRGFIRQSGTEFRSVADRADYVFRCLNNFTIPDVHEHKPERQFEIQKVAMPLLATGNQKVPVELMLPRVLERATFWLAHGLPLTELKIVAYRDAEAAQARTIFEEFRRPSAGFAGEPGTWQSEIAATIGRDLVEACAAKIEERLRQVANDDERKILDALFERIGKPGFSYAAVQAQGAPAVDEPYDVFISYAHKQGELVGQFVEELTQRHPGWKIFYDRSSIHAGDLWIKTISDAVVRSKAFVAILSPDYSASPVCWDEFQCAKLREYNTKQKLIRTVLLMKDTNLPPIMAICSWEDCTEADAGKLRKSVESLFGA